MKTFGEAILDDSWNTFEKKIKFWSNYGNWCQDWKNRDDMEIDELDDLDEQYLEINTDNEGDIKIEDDIQDDTNIPATEKEEVGENNL